MRDWPADAAAGDRAPIPLPGLHAPELGQAGGVRVVHRRLSQGNLCLGMPGGLARHPDRWALDLLGAVLGDGMSSRLFLELRERRSLAYDVSTFASTYADCGTFGVHAGFDPDQARGVVVAIRHELERVVQEPISGAELDRALRLHPWPPRAAHGGDGRGRLVARQRREPAAPDPDRRGGRRAPRVGDARRHAARRTAVPCPEHARLAVLGPFRSARRFERALAG